METPNSPQDGWSGSDPDRWRLPPEDFKRGLGAPAKRPRTRPRPSPRRSAPGTSRVLGGTYAPTEPPTVWEREPLLTVKSDLRLFAYGVPIVLVLGAVLAFVLRTVDLPTALLSGLAFQAVGIAGLYGIAQRRRTDPLKKHLPGQDLRPM